MPFLFVKNLWVAANAINLSRFLGTLILILSCLPSLAEQTTTQQTCQQIRSTVLRRYVGYARRDAKDYLALYTSDFVEILQTGRLQTYRSLRRGIISSFSKPRAVPNKPYWCEYRILHCALAGNQATVDALITVGNPVYKSSGKEIDHYFYGDGHVIDLWQKTGGVWALKHRQELYFRTSWPKQKRSHLL